MSQSYEIFINQSRLILINPDHPALNKVKREQLYHGTNNLRTALEACRKVNYNVIYLSGSADKLLEELKKIYTGITAAGGIVVNSEGALLWILRHGVWDLPKGKIEGSESADIAALREVEEECSIKNLQLLSYFDATYHTYYYEDKPVIKTTYWYHIYTDNPGEPKPQTEEGITKVEWFRPEQLLPVLESTYGNIRSLIEKFLQKHKL